MAIDIASARSERALPTKIGRYRILCELGQGAMAVLYLGRAVGPGSFERLFAIKTIHAHLCKERAFVSMFLNEARLSAKLHHPNLISVYEVDVDNGRYYLAMDYMSGENLALTLKHTWNGGRPFPIDMTAYIVAQAAEGLNAAHELKDAQGSPLNVVHRDVAPQNIMLGYDGAVRVMDFGIAKARDTVSSTRPGSMKGTVAYMAPEQVRAEPLDRRVDVFALGVVLWETTVGKRLFKASNDINTAARVLQMSIPRPSTLREGYPLELEGIILKALAREPSERYPTTRALGEDLQDFLVRHSLRVSPADLERFMKDVFGPLYEERAEMERTASAAELPDRVLRLPRHEDADSLDGVDVSNEAELDALNVFAPAKAPLPREETIPDEPLSSRRMPTLVLRDGRRARAAAALAARREEAVDPLVGAASSLASLGIGESHPPETDTAGASRAPRPAAEERSRVPPHLRSRDPAGSPAAEGTARIPRHTLRMSRIDADDQESVSQPLVAAVDDDELEAFSSARAGIARVRLKVLGLVGAAALASIVIVKELRGPGEPGGDERGGEIARTPPDAKSAPAGAGRRDAPATGSGDPAAEAQGAAPVDPALTREPPSSATATTPEAASPPVDVTPPATGEGEDAAPPAPGEDAPGADAPSGERAGVAGARSARERGARGEVRFSFRVAPKNATVSVNGREQSGDLVVERSERRYTIAISAPGYQTETRTVLARASARIDARLRPKGERPERSEAKPREAKREKSGKPKHEQGLLFEGGDL